MTDPTQTLAEIRERLGALNETHAEQFRSTADQVWGRPGICGECGTEWPCEARQAIDHGLTLLAAIDAVLAVCDKRDPNRTEHAMVRAAHLRKVIHTALDGGGE